MPDTKVKIHRGEFPDQAITEKMKLGDMLLWIPDDTTRKVGCTPTLYRMEELEFFGKKYCALAAYFPLSPHLVPRG